MPANTALVLVVAKALLGGTAVAGAGTKSCLGKLKTQSTPHMVHFIPRMAGGGKSGQE